MSLNYNNPPFDHPRFQHQFVQNPDGTRAPWFPRVFRSRIDGTLAIENPLRRHEFVIGYIGPVADQLRHFRGSYLTEEFVCNNQALDFVELVPGPAEAHCTLEHVEEGL